MKKLVCIALALMLCMSSALASGASEPVQVGNLTVTAPAGYDVSVQNAQSGGISFPSYYFSNGIETVSINSMPLESIGYSFLVSILGEKQLISYIMQGMEVDEASAEYIDVGEGWCCAVFPYELSGVTVAYAILCDGEYLYAVPYLNILPQADSVAVVRDSIIPGWLSFC